MRRLGNIKPVEVKVRLEDYIHLLLGIKKTGKTTLFRDLVDVHYKGEMEKGLLIGFEKGYKALDGLYAEPVEDWEDYEELVDELAEERKNVPYKLLGIDTIDKMVDFAIDKTLRESKKRDGKVVKSINEAFSGYGRGKEYCIKIIKDQISKLQNAGYGIVFIGHTKLKKKTTGLTSSMGEGVEYMQLCCNLTEDYSTIFEDMADMITYLVLDKLVDTSVETSKTAKAQVNLVFRSDGKIDCGGRFKNLPESLPWSAESYLKAFEQGVKGAILKPKTNEDIEEMAKKQENEKEKEIEKKTKKKTIEEMVSEIKSKFPELGDGAKTRLAELIQESGRENLSSLIEEDRKIVEEMYELVK